MYYVTLTLYIVIRTAIKSGVPYLHLS